MSYIGNNAIEMEPVETDNIGSLASLVLAELPECNDLLVRQQLGYALREFCRETNACVVVAPAVVRCDLHCGYSITMPAAPNGMVVGTVLGVTEGGDPMDFKVFDSPVPHIRVGGFVGDGRVLVRFSVYPKAGGEDCPKWFKERYAEAIVAGAMHHLLSMQKRAWADPQRAAEYGAKYADAINEASYRSLGSSMQGGAESAIPCGGLFM